MGYTHYCRRPPEIEKETYQAIANDTKRVLQALEEHITLAGYDGTGTPEITDEVIAFNGARDCGHPANQELSIPWPSPTAGGLAVPFQETGIIGTWHSGTEIEKRVCDGTCDYETFRFDRQEPSTPEENGLVFTCCKTGFRPYDIAVTAVLIVAKHHLGDRIRITSDGEDGHWFDGKMACQQVLGYGLEFQL